MNIFVRTPHSLKSHNGLQWKPCNFILPNAHLFCMTILFLHLSGPIEQFYTHAEMSYVFNVGLITPLGTSFPSVFLHF